MFIVAFLFYFILANISQKAILQVMVVVFLGSVLAKYGYFNMDKQRVNIQTGNNSKGI